MIIKDKKIVIISDNINDLFKNKKEKQLMIQKMISEKPHLENKDTKYVEQVYLTNYHKQINEYFNQEMTNNLVRFFVHDANKINNTYTYEILKPNLSEILKQINSDIVSKTVFFDRTTVKSIQIDKTGNTFDIEYKIVNPNLTVDEFIQKADNFIKKHNSNLNKTFVFNRSKSILPIVKQKYEEFKTRIENFEII